MNTPSATRSVSLADLAAIVGGTLNGDPKLLIDNAWPLDSARAGTITLVDHEDRLRLLEESSASAVVIPRGVTPPDLPSIEVEDVHAAFILMVVHFRPIRTEQVTGIHPTATVASSAKLGKEVSIAPGAVIGERVVIGDNVLVGANSVVENDCQIGEGTFLAAGVTLYPGTTVGARCRLHSGVVLGADGFGYNQKEGVHELVAQLGTVAIGDDVEIGANSSIDRGVYGPTRVGHGTKIDNLVQIGHNCQIGCYNLICSLVGIAGSTSTGDYVVMAGQVGVRDHVHIGQGAILSAMAGVSNDVPDGAIMLGAPATPLRRQKLQMAAVAKLPEMRKEFKAMRRELKELREQLSTATDKRAA